MLADVAVVEQGGELRVDDQDHVAAVAAVAAGRAAAGDELLPPPGDGAVAAVAGLRRGSGPRRRTSLAPPSKRRAPRARRARGARDGRRGPAAARPSGTTETTRRSPRVLVYFTVPSTVAKSVKSLPMPDVLAGVEERADLADQDVAGDDLLRAVDLHAAVLPGGVAAVAAESPVPFCEPLRASFPSGRASRGPR